MEEVVRPREEIRQARREVGADLKGGKCRSRNLYLALSMPAGPRHLNSGPRLNVVSLTGHLKMF